jgi:molybdate transport system substrate-binding protein
MFRLAVTFFLLLPLLRLPAMAEPVPTIAAAASLRDVLPAVVDAFVAQGGVRPRLSFGASGNLRRQIAQGAPFEVFLSADEGFVLDLAREGHTLDEGAVYALGRLAILVPAGSDLAADASLYDLGAALDDGRLHRLAIANPDHAPYGLAAREVLERRGLWDRAQSRLALGENASQAAQFVVAGGADAGIVAFSLALSPRLAACCRHAPISAELHAPLKHRGALIRGAGEDARRFFTFLLGFRGRAILVAHGFNLPDGAG